MKFHKEIVSKLHPVYDVGKAKELFNKGVNHRKLSLMKQENIRIALRQVKFKLGDIKNSVVKGCGYCFKFPDGCNYCSLAKKIKVYCADSIKWGLMIHSVTKKEFAKYHKVWCKKLGLWKQGWS